MNNLINRRDFIKTCAAAGLALNIKYTGGKNMPDKENVGARPNVVFVITDDQGYGDLGCHGNPIIRTPNIDNLHSESVRLDNFHVGPTCAPTRAGIMTGRYCNCTGVWHTIMGRSLLRANEVTMADAFNAGGYKTGMFGKWHLGDNVPFRPHDRGFQTALYHGGGGVSQTPDYWGNDYFDDTYMRNGVPEAFEGYCTDVWFREAMKFIEQNKDEPFFCYLSTNAPHGPFNVDDSYSDPYKGKVPDSRANFYGMITNIDDNVGRLRAKLKELGIEENTILIWMTDNGTAEGCRLDRNSFVTEGYNAGMRGVKGSEYEGGHRTPLFMYWPDGGLNEGRDVKELTANIDLMPTLIDMCDLKTPEGADFHGTSIKSLIMGDADNWPDRVVVTDSQRVEYPIKWRKSATMTYQWRLINGVELYDIQADPGQRNNIAEDHPDVVEELREHYEKWWDIVSATFDDDCPIVIGSDKEDEARITTHDWHGETCAWNQGMVRQGVECNGYWIVEIAENGDYQFELRRWPKEEDRNMTEGIPGEIKDWYTGGNALDLKSARMKIGDQEKSKSVDPNARGVKFNFTLKSGVTRMQTYLTDNNDFTVGAYFVYAKKI
ncbi:sulfatase-like hydrolase/transferase [Candidatus Poribacteria bacterium]|nr:sulfatase-like hydrolase/transferase [Candidatus Poribacteria bacterium]